MIVHFIAEQREHQTIHCLGYTIQQQFLVLSKNFRIIIIMYLHPLFRSLFKHAVEANSLYYSSPNNLQDTFLPWEIEHHCNKHYQGNTEVTVKSLPPLGESQAVVHQQLFSFHAQGLNIRHQIPSAANRCVNLWTCSLHACECFSV